MSFGTESSFSLTYCLILQNLISKTGKSKIKNTGISPKNMVLEALASFLYLSILNKSGKCKALLPHFSKYKNRNI